MDQTNAEDVKDLNKFKAFKSINSMEVKTGDLSKRVQKVDLILFLISVDFVFLVRHSGTLERLWDRFRLYQIDYLFE